MNPRLSQMAVQLSSSDESTVVSIRPPSDRWGIEIRFPQDMTETENDELTWVITRLNKVLDHYVDLVEAEER